MRINFYFEFLTFALLSQANSCKLLKLKSYKGQNVNSTCDLSFRKVSQKKHLTSKYGETKKFLKRIELLKGPLNLLLESKDSCCKFYFEQETFQSLVQLLL